MATLEKSDANRPPRNETSTTAPLMAAVWKHRAVMGIAAAEHVIRCSAQRTLRAFPEDEERTRLWAHRGQGVWNLWRVISPRLYLSGDKTHAHIRKTNP